MIQDNLFRKPQQAQARPTVTAVQEGGVTLLIDGETEASQMVCACLASYTPAAGDRVFFQRVGGAMLVLGKI